MKTAEAKLKFLKTSPRKVRLVVDLVRGKKVDKAIEILKVLNKGAAKPVLKLIESAKANAKHNHQIKEETLKIAKITVDDGPTMKRWMPKAHGRATTIRKRSSHVAVVLSGEAGEIKTKETKIKKKTIAKKEKGEKIEDKKEIKKDEVKSEGKKEVKKK